MENIQTTQKIGVLDFLKETYVFISKSPVLFVKLVLGLVVLAFVSLLGWAGLFVFFREVFMINSKTVFALFLYLVILVCLFVWGTFTTSFAYVYSRPIVIKEIFHKKKVLELASLILVTGLFIALPYFLIEIMKVQMPSYGPIYINRIVLFSWTVFFLFMWIVFKAIFAYFAYVDSNPIVLEETSPKKKALELASLILVSGLFVVSNVGWPILFVIVSMVLLFLPMWVAFKASFAYVDSKPIVFTEIFPKKEDWKCLLAFMKLIVVGSVLLFLPLFCVGILYGIFLFGSQHYYLLMLSLGASVFLVPFVLFVYLLAYYLNFWPLIIKIFDEKDFSLSQIKKTRQLMKGKKMLVFKLSVLSGFFCLLGLILGYFLKNIPVLSLFIVVLNFILTSPFGLLSLFLYRKLFPAKN